MAKNTSITLADHFDGFITGQVNSGRFGSASEVIRAALRLFENTEIRLETLRKMLNEGDRVALQLMILRLLCQSLIAKMINEII